jgi:hypothetical protein
MANANLDEMNWKSEQEWIIMRYFRENFPDFPKGRLTKGESPDFRLWIARGRFIGIELTQIHAYGESSAVPGFLDFRFARQQLEETLRAKEEKIRLYRTGKPVEIWLIIYADYTEANAVSRLRSDERPISGKSGFNRLFLFDIDKHQITELTPTAWT